MPRRPHRAASGPRARTWASKRSGRLSAALLPFVQIELAGVYGLEDGRYLAREPERVLVVRVAGAPQPPRRLLRKPRPKPAAPVTEPSTVPVSTITVIRAEPLGSDDEAAAWLAGVRGDDEAIDAELGDALRTANLALHAHRTAALDPFLADIATEHALAVRIGFGQGEALADGDWVEAITLPVGTRRRRLESLGPQERVAAVIGRRETLDAFTGAILRARADADADRFRDAALQLRVGVEAMLADRESFKGHMQEKDLTALDEGRRGVGEAANAALERELTAAQVESLRETLRVCERILRRRRAYG